MKIHDKLKAVDYYDFAYAPHLDKNLVYVREEQHITGSKYWNTFDEHLPLYSNIHDHPLYDLDCILNSIREYYGLHLISVLINGKFYSYFKNMKTNDIPLSINDVIEKIKNNDNNIIEKRGGKGCRFNKSDYVVVINHLGNSGLRPLGNIVKTLQHYEELLYSDYTVLNEKYDTPILLISNYDGVTSNPNLKNYGFHHILSGEQTIQEISLYLGKKKDNFVVLEPTNEIKIAKHGFDKKSFKR